MVEQSSTSSADAPARRNYRQGSIHHAYSIQRDAAFRGMALWGFLGAGTCLLAHNMFPGFRRQTLAFKGFLTIGSAIFGLCIAAEGVLQDYEGQKHSDENLIRDRARTELGIKGRVASEVEIEKWRIMEREKLINKYRQQQAEADSESSKED